MIPCAIIGDSIALSLAMQMPECAVDAKIGIGSAQIIGRVQGAAIVIISVGSNDPDNPKLRENCEAIRAKAIAQGAQRIVWIMPANLAAVAIASVAVVHGDTLVSFLAGHDGVHPLSERALAADVRKAM